MVVFTDWHIMYLVNKLCPSHRVVVGVQVGSITAQVVVGAVGKLHKAKMNCLVAVTYCM